MRILLSFLAWSLICAVFPAATRAEPNSASFERTPVPAASTNEGASLGFAVQRFQDDFGLGALLSTPSMAADSLRVTAAGGVAWYPEARTGAGKETWDIYGHTRLVVEGGRRIAGTPLRLYGFGGPTLLVAPRLSSDPLKVGGIGGFGFEFLMPRHGVDGPVSYRIELGGLGVGARADKQSGSPMFANGFFVGASLHFYPRFG